MTTICPGWTTPHQPPVVLKPEDGINLGAVSHGMCAACKADMERELMSETCRNCGCQELDREWEEQS